MQRFEEKTVLITGGAGGMGVSHLRGFLSEGANVVIGDVRDERGRAIAADLGTHAHYVHLDVTSEADWQKAITETERLFGPISVLVNNAGILSRSATIEKSDPGDFRHVLDVNLTGSYLGIRATVPSLRCSSAPTRRPSSPARSSSPTAACCSVRPWPPARPRTRAERGKDKPCRSPCTPASTRSSTPAPDRPAHPASAPSPAVTPPRSGRSSTTAWPR
ncbi:SDR family NAD(P)-dependent oxidoreductase [Amycolatopsis sp. NPDC049688]|uniref:SDR family NAD(P)-dependent oxidoreductase n=1 Tax=Amycolatopsis sp. NPDC049688 TaxID=3154733 RepID=UPI0034137352